MKISRASLASLGHRVVTLVTLVTFASTLVPWRVARADTSSAPAPGLLDGAMGLSPGAGAAGAATADPMGSAQLSYPFALPTARGDAQPSLRLTYDSSSGVGFAGVGWTLHTPSIVRKGSAGVPRFSDPLLQSSATYDSSKDPATDDFYIDGTLLLPVQMAPQLPPGLPGVPQDGHVWISYRTELDDGARYFFDGLTWVQQTKSGHLRQFGTPFDGGPASVEMADEKTGEAQWAGLSVLTGGIPPRNLIYRWNLVRDADASGNTVYYVWDDESQLLGVNPRTAGTLYLTDVYDTPSTPTPTPPATTQSAPTCSGPPPTQFCDQCGTQTSTCVGGTWQWGACTGQGACTAGATQGCTVATTGTAAVAGTQTCDSTCQWGACVANPPPTCSGSPPTQACGFCGTQTSTCVNGAWQWGPCTGQGCQPGTVQDCTSPMLGTQGTQTCDDTCQWGTCFSTPPPTCPGSPPTQPCGNCGTQTSTCVNGAWQWGACTGQGACAASTTQSCGSGGTQTCDPTTCQWGTCTCTGPSTQPCGNCGEKRGECVNGSWQWGTCNNQGCAPNTTQTCGGVGSQTCTATCGWGPCVCPSGFQLVGGTCQPITGSAGKLLDHVLGVFEKEAHADPTGPAPSPFAHHVHLTWSLPSYPGYPTVLTTTPGNIAPYAFSPIWRALPFAQLARVDVFSATTSSPARQLVREYQLSYTYNDAQTRSFLHSIQMVGDCDSVGGIPETDFDPTKAAACAAAEKYPPTTYRYYGIPDVPPPTAPPPVILAETPVYSAPAAADFLADLNGDAVADLVVGNNGTAGVEACLLSTCQVSLGDYILHALSFAFYAPECQCSAPVSGPDQGNETYPVSVTNGLYSYQVDDSMWAFSVFGDWGANGRTGFLELVPPNPTLPTGASGFTNTNALAAMPGQLSDPDANLQTTFQGAFGVDFNELVGKTIPASRQVPGASGPKTTFMPSRAFDFDGDGLPDMGFTPDCEGDYACPKNKNPVRTHFTTRDHAGVTHPFVSYGVHEMSPFEEPAWSWGTVTYTFNSPFNSPAHWTHPLHGGEFHFHYEDPNCSAQCGVWDWATIPQHAAADIDGDGLLDEVMANKYDAQWNKGLFQFLPTDNSQLLSNATLYGLLSYVGLVVLPNRGDGRFGVPAADFPQSDMSPSAQTALQALCGWLGVTGCPAVFPDPLAAAADDTTFADYGHYVVPGATSPFAPSWVPLGRQAPGAIVPPPQSDAVPSPAAVGNDVMQADALRFGDLNGDGMADYALLDAQGLHICLRYGGWWDAAHWKCVSDLTFAGNDQSDSTIGHPSIFIGDLNGSGINQVVYFPAPDPSGSPYGKPAGQATAFAVSPHGGGQSDRAGQPKDGLLESVDNGVGGTTGFTYDTVHNLHLGHVPVPRWVLTSVTTMNGLPGAQGARIRKVYTYGSAIYDALSSEFVGFQSVTEMTEDDPSGQSPGRITRTSFATQTDRTAGAAGYIVPEALIHRSRALPVLTEVMDTQLHRLRTTVTRYGFTTDPASLDGRRAISLWSHDSSTYIWDPSAQGSATSVLYDLVTLTTSDGSNPVLPPIQATLPFPSGTILESKAFFDANGNEFLSRELGVVGVDTPIDRQTTWALPPGDATGWSYRPTKEIVGYENAQGVLDTTQPVREMDYAYDALGRLTQVSAPLSGGIPLPGPGGGGRAAGQPLNAVFTSPSVVLRSIQYDPTFGNVTTVGNQDNPCVASVAYDPLFAQLPTSTTVYPGGCGTAGLTSSTVFDRRLEKATATLDPSGRMSATRYDDFGRVVEIDQPNIVSLGATTKVLTASYSDAGPVRQVVVQTAYGTDHGATAATTFASHYRYVDGLGETRALVDQVDPTTHTDPTTHAPQSWVVSGVHSSYVNGRVATVYQPMFAAAPIAGTTLPPEALAPTSPSATSRYDALGRVWSATDFNGAVSTVSFNDPALSMVLRDPEQVNGSHTGSFTVITKDGHGRTASTDAHWAVGPDAASGDLVTKATYLATGETTSITQSSPGRTVVRQMTYDSLGRMVQNTEPNAGTWTYAYDAEGRVAGTSDARGCGENFSYDKGGRLLAADYSPCDPSQPAYSPLLLTLSVFPYLGAEESYAYDPVSGLVTQAADRGRSDAYSYNPAGYLARIDRQIAVPSAGTITVPGLPPPYGATHSEKFSSYTFDGVATFTSITPTTLPTQTIAAEARSFGLDGMLSGISAGPTGVLLQKIAYDPSGRTLSTEYGTGSTNSFLHGTTGTFTYDNNGSLVGFNLARAPFGTPVAYHGYTPPPSGDPSLIQNLTQVAIYRDLVGNPVSEHESAVAGWPAGAVGLSRAYTYSDDYRLTKVATAPPDSFVDPYLTELTAGSHLYPQPSTPSTGLRSQVQSFTYDWRGNVESSTDDASDFFDRSLGTVTSAPGSDRLVSASPASGTSGGSVAAVYDLAGNLTQLAVSKGPSSGPGTLQYSYDWDELGHLASATRTDASGTVSEEYGYAAGGVRTWTGKTVQGTTLYTVDVFDGLVLKDAAFTTDYQDDQTTEQLYFAGRMARVFLDTTGQLPHGQYGASGLATPLVHAYMTLSAPRGSSSFTLDMKTMELVERTQTLAYGGAENDWRNPRWQQPREDLKFGGHWDNAEVGLVYFGARYYSSQLGRFISPDPLTIHGLAGDPNPYEFAKGNPTRYVDPTGLDVVDGDSATTPSANITYGPPSYDPNTNTLTVPATVPIITDSPGTTSGAPSPGSTDPDEKPGDPPAVPTDPPQGAPGQSAAPQSSATSGASGDTNTDSPIRVHYPDETAKMLSAYAAELRNSKDPYALMAKNHSGQGKFDFLGNADPDVWVVPNVGPLYGKDLGNYIAGYGAGSLNDFGAYTLVRAAGAFYAADEWTGVSKPEPESRGGGPRWSLGGDDQISVTYINKGQMDGLRTTRPSASQGFLGDGTVNTLKFVRGLLPGN